MLHTSQFSTYFWPHLPSCLQSKVAYLLRSVLLLASWAACLYVPEYSQRNAPTNPDASQIRTCPGFLYLGVPGGLNA